MKNLLIAILNKYLITLIKIKVNLINYKIKNKIKFHYKNNIGHIHTRY